MLSGGKGNDTLIGGRGSDIIQLGETVSGPGSAAAPGLDTVVVNMGDSVRGMADTVYGFDVTSADSALHDVLSLPSNLIAADIVKTEGTHASGGLATGGTLTITSHSIAGGIVTFYDGTGATVAINAANRGIANDYLSLNMNIPGETVAFAGDTTGDNVVDTLHVFQNNGTIPLDGNFVLPDTVIHLNGVVGATLGTVAGANVVQLVDTTAPNPVEVALTNDGLALNFAENAYAGTGLALPLLQNGITTMNITSVDGGNGTTSMVIHTDQALVSTDWLLLNYAGSTVANGLSDVAGNVLQMDNPGKGGSAMGSDGNNTIDLSNATFYSAAKYDVNGNGGKDTIIGSAGNDWISGGTGADIMTGGTGADSFSFQQGDSTHVTVGGTPTAPTFTFTSDADLITDFGLGDSINLNSRLSDLTGAHGVGMMASPPTTTGLATDQSFYMAPGSYNATTGVFTMSTNPTNLGTDTLIVYDGDSTAAVLQTGIVLSGVTLDQLHAYTGSNYISHI
jgi:hypothetical protein